MARDEARARAGDLEGEDVFQASGDAWQRIARETPVWEADVVPVLARVRGCPDGLALVLVGAAGFVVSSDIIHQSDHLLDRQEAWVNAPNAGAGGVTPAARVRSVVEKQR